MISYNFKIFTLIALLLPTVFVMAGSPLPSDTEHQVGIGDTIELIAKRYAGDEKHIDIIRAMNPHIDEVGLQIGDYLFVPDEPLDQKQGADTNNQSLPPSPIQKNNIIKIIPGVKYGLAHVYHKGGFNIVSAPVDQE